MVKKIDLNPLKKLSTEVESKTTLPSHHSVNRQVLSNQTLTDTPYSFGKPGPFQIIESETLDLPSDAPKRRYSCSNYETCLNMAAALNWDNFTCRGCSGEVNASLLWRAQSESRKDSVVKEICPDFTPKTRREPFTDSNTTPPDPAFPYQMIRSAGKR